MFFLVPRFVLHKNAMLAQKPNSPRLRSSITARSGFEICSLSGIYPRYPREQGASAPLDKAMGIPLRNWVILSAGKTFFQTPSWSIGGSADPAVPDGLDAVRQTVDPVRGGGGLIVRLLT
jgi:hypothetical protein